VCERSGGADGCLSVGQTAADSLRVLGAHTDALAVSESHGREGWQGELGFE